MAAFTTPQQQMAAASGLDGPAPADQPVAPIIHRAAPPGPSAPASQNQQPPSARKPPYKKHHKKAHARPHTPSPPSVSKGRR